METQAAALLSKAVTCAQRKQKQHASANGNKVIAVLKCAQEAAQRTSTHRLVSQAQWHNRWAVLSGVLPAWAEGGSTNEKGPDKVCAAALNAGIDTTVHTITEWHQCAKAGLTFARAREQHRGLMQLTLRAWKEQVERATPQQPHTPEARRARRSRSEAEEAMPTMPTREEELHTMLTQGCEQEEGEAPVRGGDGTDGDMARRRREDWSDIHPASRRWNPWGTRNPDPAQDNEEEEEESVTGPPAPRQNTQRDADGNSATNA